MNAKVKLIKSGSQLRM